MDQISERTWVAVGAVVGGGVCVALLCAIALPSSAVGTLYVSVSDASRTVHKVREISVEVTSIELHKPGQGWVSVVSSPHVYNLFSLKRSGAFELAGQARLPAGLYDQVRMNVGRVAVYTTGGDVYDAALGSHAFTVVANTVVGDRLNSHINIDINAASSLHVAQDGAYVFVPVVAFTSAEDIVAHMDTAGTIVSSGGTVISKVVVGSDLTGRTYRNLSLAPDLPLAIADSLPHIASARGQGAIPGSVADTSLVQIGPDGSPRGE